MQALISFQQVAICRKYVIPCVVPDWCRKSVKPYVSRDLRVSPSLEVTKR